MWAVRNITFSTSKVTISIRPLYPSARDYYDRYEMYPEKRRIWYALLHHNRHEHDWTAIHLKVVMPSLFSCVLYSVLFFLQYF